MASFALTERRLLSGLTESPQHSKTTLGVGLATEIGRIVQKLWEAASADFRNSAVAAVG